MSKLYGIGVGPGDEELLTLKSINILKKVKVIVAPSAKDSGESIALNTVLNFIRKDAEIIIKHFPMALHKECKVYEAFESIEEKLNSGYDIAFLTLGDPFIYSTYVYLLEYVKQKGYNTETVPGITSFCASASVAGETLVIGNEPLLILPASRLDSIKDEKYIVIMKFYKNEEKVLNFLENKGFKYVCVRRAYREGQQVLRERKDIIQNKDYMSLIIAHRD